MKRSRSQEHEQDSRGRVGRWLLLVLLFILGVFVLRDYRGSVILGSPYRYNLVMAGGDGGEVVFVSMDPEEKQVFGLELPSDLYIRSRSYGTYKVGSLYKLGQYEQEPGVFVKRKVQGFMRVPILGFLQDVGSGEGMRGRFAKSAWSQVLAKEDLSYFDRLTILFRGLSYNWSEGGTEELLREGVITEEEEGYDYNQERLRTYLGTRVFDWTIGSQDTTVSVINESGKDGLGTDIAEYMTNLGFDVVSVRGGEVEREETLVMLSEKESTTRETASIMEAIFGWSDQEVASTDEYRAEVVIKLGADAEDLF